MRTTIRLDDELLSAAKQRAAAERITLTALIEGALRQTLAPRPVASSGRFKIEPFGEGGVMPGVDLDDSVSLRDLLDGMR